MTNVEDAFFQGLVDGTANYESVEKVAGAFFQGLGDGADAAQHVSIMDKIAMSLDEGEDVEEVEVSASDMISTMIRGDEDA